MITVIPTTNLLFVVDPTPFWKCHKLAELKTVDLDKIRIPDVRVSSILDPEQKALLSSSIKEVGVVQDIVVREVAIGTYELVAGNLLGCLVALPEWAFAGRSSQRSLVHPKGWIKPAHRT